MAGPTQSKQDDKTWRKAKAIVARQRNKVEASFADRDWALCHRVYNNMVKSSVRAAAETGDVKVLLARVESILTARQIKDKKDKDDGLPEDVRILVEALSAVMASGGQTIAALRRSKSSGMKPEEAEKLAGHLASTAKTIGELLEKLKG